MFPHPLRQALRPNYTTVRSRPQGYGSDSGVMEIMRDGHTERLILPGNYDIIDAGFRSFEHAWN